MTQTPRLAATHPLHRTPLLWAPSFILRYFAQLPVARQYTELEHSLWGYTEGKLPLAVQGCGQTPSTVIGNTNGLVVANGPVGSHGCQSVYETEAEANTETERERNCNNSPGCTAPRARGLTVC